MKKSLLIFALSLIVVVSGYAATVPAVEDTSKEAVSSWAVEDNSPLVGEKEAKAQEVQNVELSCDTCAPEVEEREHVNCAKKVKVVRYADKCANGCGFPVSIRVDENCPNEGEI